MARIHIKRLLTNISILLAAVGCIFILQTHYSKNQKTNVSKLIIKKQNPPKLYFETEDSYLLRLEVQAQIKFSSKLKDTDPTFFNSREGYNESFLDSIPIVREDIPDLRLPTCHSITYPVSRARVSVIINYHNELLSLVLRSVYSVLRAIPPHNFHELILIDDGSNLQEFPHLQIIKEITASFTVRVKHIRFEKNEGLIYSRRYGCLEATGDTILVLDSHVDMSPGFIEPLLAITDKNYNSIASPIIQFLDSLDTYRIWAHNESFLAFDPYLTWIFANAPTGPDPYHVASIFGGAFVATKRFLEEVDYFGRGMVGWGYENMEISMKTWMCGEAVHYVPCSQILHYNAKRSPMNHGDRSKPDFFLHNAALVIKSFFPEHNYQEFSLDYNIHERTDFDIADYEDVIRRNKRVLQENGCTRDYPWLRKKLMPHIESFDAETLVAHTLNVDGQCVLVEFTIDKKNWKGTMVECGDLKSIRKNLRLTIWDEVRIFDRLCLDFGFQSFHFNSCHGGSGMQKVIFENNRLRSINNLCIVRYNGTNELGVAPCTPKKQSNYTIPFIEFEVVYNRQYRIQS